MLKKILLTFLALFITTTAFAKSTKDLSLQELLESKTAIIYEINLRTFSAKDLNNNEIVDGTELSGNFLNAIKMLDELKLAGVNVLHLMPITPVGKIHAIGTAGSLYATSDFSSINPQLIDNKSKFSPLEQAKKFIEECHKRGIKVIIDLPACGAYDLYLTNPELFELSEDGKPVIPNDWNDVGLLDKDKKEVLDLYKKFVEMVLKLNADGVVANAPELKSEHFWKEITNYTSKIAPSLLFFAESTSAEVLKWGFDEYYAKLPNIKNWNMGSELIVAIEELKDKNAISNFSTHTEISPLIINGEEYSKMIIWLNSTLPINAHYTDGFSTGFDYDYPWSNKRASKTYTDSDFYFVDKGKIDLFNFSARPVGNNAEILKEFLIGNRFKILLHELMPNGKFKGLQTDKKNAFAYTIKTQTQALIVVGNLDFVNSQQIKVSIPRIKPNQKIANIRVTDVPTATKNKLNFSLNAGEIQIILLNNFTIK